MQQFDIFATHEPSAAAELRKLLAGPIRQTNSGTPTRRTPPRHPARDSIDLVEGSTGAGGLDNIVRGVARPPIEFSIESVAADCQFTRASASRSAPRKPRPSDQPAAYGDDVTATTVYFTPQKVAADRECSPSLGVSAPRGL